MPIVPTSFLFRVTLPVQRLDRLPRAKAPLLALPESYRVPCPSLLDGGDQFADLALAWNPEGLAVQATVRGKQMKPFCDPSDLGSSDGLLLWIDTRDARSLHRATRFCHHFVALPAGGGSQESEPILLQRPIPRAGEDAPQADAESFLVEADADNSGYRLSVWFPAESLHGFDPASQPRLGFHMAVHDTELGWASLSQGTEFPIFADPSLWTSLELVSETSS